MSLLRHLETYSEHVTLNHPFLARRMTKWQKLPVRNISVVTSWDTREVWYFNYESDNSGYHSGKTSVVLEALSLIAIKVVTVTANTAAILAIYRSNHHRNIHLISILNRLLLFPLLRQLSWFAGSTKYFIRGIWNVFSTSARYVITKQHRWSKSYTGWVG